MFQLLIVRLDLDYGRPRAALAQAEVYASAGIYTMWAHVHASMGIEKTSSLS